ncbi:hypothetical protein P7K49_011890 [Saguinus oedipus]|uniref:Uncharacterized protein n=1 Tax=Saguinus oedipus TaxID=9490 RepID=A0ABQ9VRY5_SAGOE|nr:hypothetical protein P7K49_011890 [Saguinus oedipus]
MNVLKGSLFKIRSPHSTVGSDCEGTGEPASLASSALAFLLRRWEPVSWDQEVGFREQRFNKGAKQIREFFCCKEPRQGAPRQRWKEESGNRPPCPSSPASQMGQLLSTAVPQHTEISHLQQQGGNIPRMGHGYSGHRNHGV